MFKPVLTLIEKVASTYVQALLALVILSGTVSFTEELAIAALPAALTVLANALPTLGLPGLPFAAELVFRIVRSFVATFIGYLLAVPVFTLDPSVLQAAKTAGLMAALVVVKGLVAKQVGSPDSPALLPQTLAA